SAGHRSVDGHRRRADHRSIPEHYCPSVSCADDDRNWTLRRLRRIPGETAQELATLRTFGQYRWAGRNSRSRLLARDDDGHADFRLSVEKLREPSRKSNASVRRRI